MAKPKKGDAKGKFNWAAKHKNKLIAGGVAVPLWCVGIPVVPGFMETIGLGAAGFYGYVKDKRNEKNSQPDDGKSEATKQRMDERRQRYLPKNRR